MVRNLIKHQRDRLREARIEEHVRPSRKTGRELASSWRAYIQRFTSFPFVATYVSYGSNGPFQPSAVVQVLGLAAEEHCDNTLMARVMDGHRSVLVPLAQLTPVDQVNPSLEATRDWRYWCMAQVNQ